MSMRRGQSLLEYAILLSAVVVGVMIAAKVTQQSFIKQAQEIERSEIVF